MVARAAARWPGPEMAGRGSVGWRHMPVFGGWVNVKGSCWGEMRWFGCGDGDGDGDRGWGRSGFWGKGFRVQVARFLPSAEGVPNQYFSRPPLAVASAWEFWSRRVSSWRDVVGGMRERKIIMSVREGVGG